MVVRDALQEECPARNGYETVGLILEDEGRRIGALFLSIAHGCVLAHDWRVEPGHPMGAARLLLAAKKKVKELGMEKFYLHVPEGEEIKTLDFWKRHTRKVMEIWEGEV